MSREYIENDKTKKKEIQRMAVGMSKKEAEKDRGTAVKRWHWKITVNRKMYKQNENKGHLKSQKFWERNATARQRNGDIEGNGIYSERDRAVRHTLCFLYIKEILYLLISYIYKCNNKMNINNKCYFWYRCFL